MRNATLWILAALLLLLTAACNALSPEQQHSIDVVLREMYDTGKLTLAQYEALRDALATGSYDRLLDVAVEVGAAVVLALFGVRVWRGPIGARKGILPALAASITEQQAPPAQGGGNGS